MTDRKISPAIQALRADVGSQWRSLISVVSQHAKVKAEDLYSNCESGEPFEMKSGLNSNQNQQIERIWNFFWSAKLSPKGIASHSSYIAGEINDAIVLHLGVAERLSNDLPALTLCMVAMAGEYPPDGTIKREVLWNRVEEFPSGEYGVPRFYTPEFAAQLIWRAKDVVAYKNLIESIKLPW